MADEKVAAAIESADEGATAEESTPISQESLDTSETGEPLVGTGETTETPTEKPAVEEKPVGDAEVESEIDAILAQDNAEEAADTHKDGVQKRIDKLTARNKELQEKLEKYETKENETPSSEPKYTEEQLKRAHTKAVQEGDADLAWEIQQYQLKQVKKELRDEYIGEQKKARETQERTVAEWKDTVDTYSYLADSKEKEIYPGSRRELNLMDQNSLFYQIALRLYNSQDPEKFRLYHQPGGQKLAVADALQYLLKKRRDRLASRDDVKGVERKLAKEKRKSSLGTGESLQEDNTPPKKFASDKDRLDDYLAERTKLRNDRIGAF